MNKETKNDSTYLGYTRPSPGIIGKLIDEKSPRPLFVRIISIAISLIILVGSLYFLFYICYSFYEIITGRTVDTIGEFIIPGILGIFISILFITIGIKGLKINVRGWKSSRRGVL